jgi:hypothetical protein
MKQFGLEDYAFDWQLLFIQKSDKICKDCNYKLSELVDKKNLVKTLEKHILYCFECEEER